MIDKDKVCRMLSKGMKAADVAAIVGCEQSYIAELFQEEEFQLKVMTARVAAAEAHVEHDVNIDALESKILKQLDKSLAWCMKPEVLMKAFQILNGAKRRSDVGDVSNSANVQVVNLSLPTVIVAQIKINNSGRVVQIDDRELVTLDNNSFEKLAAGHATPAERLALELQEGLNNARLPESRSISGLNTAEAVGVDHDSH